MCIYAANIYDIRFFFHLKLTYGTAYFFHVNNM